MQSKPSSPIAVKAAAVYAAVLALGLLCIAAPREVGRLSPIWLPNALIFSVYLRSRYSHWWVIGLAGAAGNLTANFLAGDHSGVAFGLTSANVLECLCCALAVRRFSRGGFDIAVTRDLVRLAVIVTPCALSSGLISSTVVGVFRGDDLERSLLTWLTSHTLGYFILAPCLLLLSRPRVEDEPRLRDHGWTLVVLTAVATVTFAQSSFPLLFLIPPALLLVTWRLELFGSALGVLIVTAIGTIFSMTGHGPTSLAHGDTSARILVLQAFLAVGILASLPVANQRALGRRLQASLSTALKSARDETLKLEMAASVARLGYWSLDARTGVLTWSRQMYEIFGLDADGDVDLGAAMGRVHPDDAPECQRLVDRALQFGEDYVQERIRVFRPDGEMRLTGGAVVCQCDESGAVTALFGTLSDKTEQDDVRLQRELIEQRYVEIAGKASDIVLRLDPQGVCLSVNPACESVLGYRVGEIVGRSLGWLVHPDDYGQMHAALMALRAGEARGERLLYRARHKDGRWKWLESQPQALRDPFDGRIVETSDVIRDVTERTEQEAALRFAEQAAQQANSLMRSAENLAHMGYVTYDLISGAMIWSDEVWRIFEADPARDTAGVELMSERRHPDDRERVLADFHAHVEAGADVYETSYRVVTPSGVTRHVMTRGHIERENGVAIGVFGVVMDVTDLRTAEHAALDSERRYRLMAENSTDIIITCALTGEVTFASPALGVVTGHAADALVGKTAMDFCHPDDARPIQANFIRVISGEAPERLRWRGRHQGEARWIWFESNPALLRDPDTGVPTGYLDVVRDITAQKAQEDALAAARLEAERAMRSKAEFLANMSHELRTPLNSIIGFSRLLAERDTLSAEDRRQIDLVHGAGQALHAVIDNVLDFSKLEASALTLDPAPFDVVTMARKATALLEPQAADKDIGLKFVLDGPESLSVLGDEGRLRQVLLNFLSNAVKFTKTGEVRVTLSADSEDGRGRFRIEVSDTGLGIAPDKLAGLFNRFAQADATTATRYGGTGLGLAISKQLVELMGGSVGATSAIGEGSAFWMALDLPRAAVAATGGVDEDVKPSLAGRTVLVVDDVDLNRQLMSALLAKQGCVVDMAENGVEALERMETCAYDLVLMDCQMPVMDGFAATRAIRASGKPYAATPIVALTASADVEHLARCEAAGMDAHLTKPLNPGALEAAMRRFLAPRAAEPDVAAADPALRQALVESVGRGALAPLMTLLLEQLSEKLQSDEPDLVREDAHALAGASGLMGYSVLSEACRDLEQAVVGGGDFSAPLTTVRILMIQAEADARRWLADLARSASQVA